ncbi:hypothetical protein [Vibrio viridaestus]|uniref:HAD family hydrolase n=1 Tax=Vibrio viridaestus TaxID=2487322 RepID=A0A3N9TCY9_9VIBR|nr:hypothetical protein [Vibrio viridaestus]RQW61714.1 hypothetical protein EES38_17790 [Vibrio viridaestus]
MKCYDAYFRDKTYDIYSVDIFDTLLLRKYQCEYYRFLEISKIFKRKLNIKKCVNSIWLARIEAARIAYYTFGNDQEKEPNITYIYKLMFDILDVNYDDDFLHSALELELSYESSVLSPNSNLVSFLSDRKKNGSSVIGISDMYLTSDSISRLISNILSGFQLDYLFSSADLNKSKRKGSLFPYVIDRLGIEDKKVIHCGDNYHSDYSMPIKFGIIGIYTPRSRLWQAANKLSNYRVMKRLGVL